VPLAPISDANLVPASVAAALAIHFTSTSAPADRVAAALSEKEMLMVLDNFEHVLDAAPAVVHLLSTCPRLKILVTSRAPLRVRGEQQIDIGPLGLPNRAGGAADLSATSAGSLFLERARAVGSTHPVSPDAARAIAELCHRLDGLPLAIELVAAQMKYHTPQSLLSGVERGSLSLPHGPRDLPPRQQTLRATIDWSVRLLEPDSQDMFLRLSVFRGGAALEAALAVAGDRIEHPLDALRALRDASLILLLDTDGEDERVRMLATVRTHAEEMLEERGGTQDVRDRHLAFFRALVREAQPHLTGADQASWLGRLERDRDNLRAALDWAQDSGAVREGLELLTGLRVLWERIGPLREASDRLQRFLEAGEGTCLEADVRLHCDALSMLGRSYWWQGDLDRAETTLWRAHALVPSGHSDLEARILNNLGGIAHDRGEMDASASLYRQALDAAKRAGDRWYIAAVLTNLGNLASDRGDYDRAIAWLDAALPLLAELGERRMRGMNLNVLGEVLRSQGSIDRAEATFREALALLDDVGDRSNVAYSLDCLARTARDCGAMARAARLLGASDSIRADIGITVDPAVSADRDRIHADCAAALGTAAASAARESGGRLDYDSAVALALEEGE
jgi:predicted ATPase/Tfp pilus assembly protein PilF